MTKGHYFEFPTLLNLHDGLCDRLLYAARSELDNVNSVDVQLHNVMAIAQSMSYPTHLARVWCSELRWNTMIRQYLNPDDLNLWLDTIETAFPSSKRGVCVLRTNTVQSRKGGKGTTRRWGSCMLSLSFRRVPSPQLTLHSRTSYLGYLSLLDLGVAYVAARYIASRTGIQPEDMSFCWTLECAQFHGFRCLAYPLGAQHQRMEFTQFARAMKGFTQQQIRQEYPGYYLAQTQFRKIKALDQNNTQYSEMTFSSSRRVRKRYHTEVRGLEFANQFTAGATRSDHRAYNKLPVIPFGSLTFKAIGVPE